MNKMSYIQEAIEACDSQRNCVECSKCYTEMNDNSFIPCNNIRYKYGESIWDYKKGK